MYTARHYGFVMFMLSMKRWGKWGALALVLLVFYVKGKSS